MDRTEKIQKLINTLDDLESHQQGLDFAEQDLKEQVRKLKLTKKDYKIASELGYSDLEEWINSWI